ncbi:hypothetical protein [Asticcacaulis taihuensis]|uniref:Uncharacterized protein n=1 Tax=Asticcacaulis taihuensis TaxID=260084 RepID=A0A1G4SAY9_9CAUL|nr:hypothetical protein [Asticcacaulis taihuensis]SCW66364.1 hypothetical protein SAMN02927928_2520 [Asticcacaulis taihuensis]
MFNFSNQLESLKSSIIGLVLLLASAIIGLIWVSIGLYSLAVKLLGDLWGPLALGGIFLLPIVIYLIIKALPHNREKRRQSLIDEAFSKSTVGSISNLIDSLSATSPILATVAAIVAGFMATRFPQYLPMFSQIVSALGEEFKLHKVRRAESKVRKARAEYERTANPTPPDVEPVVKRRRKRNDDPYADM